MYKILFNGKVLDTDKVPDVKGNVIVVGGEILCDKQSFTNLIPLKKVNDKEQQQVDDFLDKVKSYLSYRG